MSDHGGGHRSEDSFRGESFGRYRLLRRLGAGGMAEVFLATPSTDSSTGPVALKRMLPHLADDVAFISRFQREAMISRKLRHSSIAQVLDVGRVGRTWFMAMELVAGETLARAFDTERSSAKRMPVSIVRRVGADIASALDYAHKLSASDGRPLEIVHRDVSPQNVMLSYDGHVKLIDFGVARWADSGTRTGGIAGKVRYFSPEQARGLPVDHRSDVYSLGVMLYEALLGRPVFRRDNEIATMHAILEEDPPALDGDVPADLEAALRRAMSKAPEQRFQSADELAQVLLGGAGGGARLAAEPDDLVAYMAELFPADEARWRRLLEFPDSPEFSDPAACGEDERERVAGLSDTHARTRPPEAVPSSRDRETVNLAAPTPPPSWWRRSWRSALSKWPMLATHSPLGPSPRALALASVASLAAVVLVASFVSGASSGAAITGGLTVPARVRAGSSGISFALPPETRAVNSATAVALATTTPGALGPRRAEERREYAPRSAKRSSRTAVRSSAGTGPAPRRLAQVKSVPTTLPAGRPRWSAEALADQFEPSPYTDKQR